MIYLKNIREKQTVHIPRTEINGKVVAVKSYDEGYDDGIVEGKKLQKLKLTNLSVSENGVYKREDGWDMVKVNVPDIPPKTQQKTLYISKDTDVVLPDEGYDGLSKVNVNATQYGQNKRNEGYADGYIEGYEDGIAEGGQIDVDDTQVMNITANGTYTTQYTKGEDVGRDITGYFDDNTPFYGYARLTNHIIATGLIPTKTSRVELWWRPDFSTSNAQYIFANTSIVLNGIYLKVSGGKFSVKFGNYTKNNLLEVEDKWYHIVVSPDGLVIDGETITTLGTPSMFIAGAGLFINGDGVSTLSNVCANGYFGMVKIDGKTFIPTEDGFIDYTTDTILTAYKKGDYDYEKPTYDGNLIRTVHVNVPQNTLKTQNKILTVTKDLEVVYPDSGYNALAEVSVDATQYGQDKHSEGYTEGYKAGNTSNTVNVKILGIKLGESTFTEVPNCFDFEGLEDASYMFAYCKNLITIPPINTDGVTDMDFMFAYCDSLKYIPMLETSKVWKMSGMFYHAIDIEEIPLLDTSGVLNMDFMFDGCWHLKNIPQLDTSHAHNMSYMFADCYQLKTIPPLDTSQVEDVDYMFRNCYGLVSLPPLSFEKKPSLITIFGHENKLENLTDFGGFIGATSSIDISLLPNLSYQSCINVLNGLYDFNDETPSYVSKLVVHQNFLDKVGDQISIATNKGWKIIV